MRRSRVISEACFNDTAMTGDCHDELAAMDLSMISVALTPSWLVWIYQLCQSSYTFHHSYFFLLCFWTRNYNTGVSCIFFLFPYVSLQSDWAWNLQKSECSFRFLVEEFRFCSCYNNVSYGAWHVYRTFFVLLLLIADSLVPKFHEKKLERSPGKGKT